MNRHMMSFSAVALVLMLGTAAALNHIARYQTLAPPGVKTHALQDSIRLEADLPEHVLDYSSQRLETEDVVLATLPADTSFGTRQYDAPDSFRMVLRVVLMGRDRTSMHKPQICLTGQGYIINDAASEQSYVKIERPHPYELPVVKLIANHTVTENGRSQAITGVYVYWYVASDALSASATGFQRMWLMASRLLRTGVLQRWAYVSCFATCPPGQESATYDRVKQFIAAAVPQFQLYPGPEPAAITAAR